MSRVFKSGIEVRVYLIVSVQVRDGCVAFQESESFCINNNDIRAEALRDMNLSCELSYPCLSFLYSLNAPHCSFLYEST